jgi:hypothetical protein
MDLLTLLEIISLITTLIGLYLLGEKKASGFLIFTASLSCQLYIFYTKEFWFLFFQMIVLIVFNIYNYKKWVRG